MAVGLTIVALWLIGIIPFAKFVLYPWADNEGLDDPEAFALIFSAFWPLIALLVIPITYLLKGAVWLIKADWSRPMRWREKI